MAESAALTAVINQAVGISANLIVGTGSRLYRLKEDIEWIERRMRHFKSCLKDADSKQGGSHEVANLIIDMKDLALDIEDILDTYLLEIESHKGKGPFRFFKHAACILCYGGTTNTFSQKIEKIKSRAQEIEATRERCRINLDTDGGNADSEVWNRRKEFLVTTESMVVGREDKFQELEEKLRSSNSECKMICVVGEAGVERCGGLPLAIVVAVGMLRQRRRNKHAWNEVLDILSTSSENNCSKILSLSYNDLPPDLRPFFLYFGLFHEDEEISCDELVLAWVSEKLIQFNVNQNPYDIVAVKLEMLSDRNLIQVSTRNLDGSVRSCRIHDLLRIFCIEMSNENNFFGTHHNIHTNSFSMLRRLTIDDTSQFSFSNSATPKLRTLFCFCNSGEGWSLIPNEIGDLSRLTFLKLSGRFERMPSTIRNLKKLVTLDIRRADFNCGLPRTIFRMKHLKHLLLGYGKMFESDKCTNLNVRNEVYLRNIEILHWVPGTILKASSLQKLSNLRELRLYEINDQHINVISGKAPISEKLQELRLEFTQRCSISLSNYGHLSKLFLTAEPNFPFKLDTIEFPPNLIYLRLWFMKFTEDPMKVLKELTRLEILEVAGCIYSQSITLDFSGVNSFPELQVLAIEKSEIPELIVDQTGMPKLYKFVCNQKDLNVPERLREIMVEP
ncbi:unnamed protein product [Fraxinus pennsylvanica]|uniref:NB-ARC domain-containing protein n=1 Tax=Fraxinus pennsylvanica TaxID=56036 RepID=A0AAD2A8V9_9LAMI|nr:unnamed protein product [Fraxinus pennsylvanica]